ncbi:hypothetical protein FGG08_005612 [Glutinoglossum americanum]|uniref:Ubiquitin-like protease family profile domain-containing protein n=1 Tax=Glutinoglossum americanum TaxID=1670608 RepID=A0A9P8I3A4_9PEZI|nr:hypothetical protein FGG08_005612 [Glutinoglossum americanum]
MNTVALRYRTRVMARETTTQDISNRAVKSLAEHLKSKMGVPTPVSTDRGVTGLLGYRWVCGRGFTFPKTKLGALSEEIKAVVGALACGELEAAIETPLCLDEKPTQFAEDLRLAKVRGYENCVYLNRPSKKRRAISSSRWSANSTPPAFRSYTDDGSDHGPLLDNSGDSTRKHPQDEDTDSTHNKRSRTMTQLVGDDSFSEELPRAYVSHDPAPIPHGSSESPLTLPEPWATHVKSVEDKAHDLKRKGATNICYTSTGTGLTLKSFRPLLTSCGELDCEVIDACLSMLVRPTESSPKTVLFESTFWRTYQGRREHLSRWYNRVAPHRDVKMFLFPVYQDGYWSLFEVFKTEKTIRHYTPEGPNSIDIREEVTKCLKIEFGIEEWTVEEKLLPQGNSGVLILATAVQRVLREDVAYSEKDVLVLRRSIAAILLGRNVSELRQV